MYNNYSNKEKVNTDRYFITYADMITLLLGLFVILYASSKVDEEKYKEFSKAFTEYFHKGDGVLSGGKGVLEGSSKAIDNPTALKKTLDEVFAESKDALKYFIQNGSIQIQRAGESIILTLPEKLLFESGKAEIIGGGQVIIDTIGSILKGIKFQVTVDGHTDSEPIRTFQYESNWHLSVARSLEVGYSLLKRGIPQSNMIIRGFGSQRPIADNNTLDGKAKNRRVEITISRLSKEAPSTAGYKNEIKKIE